ncbi:MAG: hypothetical protein Q9198_002347, partial [Flavoplaca austrocitrina]
MATITTPPELKSGVCYPHLLFIRCFSLTSALLSLPPYLPPPPCIQTKTNNLASAVSLEFSFSIIVACLPTLTPLFKKLPILTTWIPTLRSKITRSNHSNSKGMKISGPIEDHDIERNALRSEEHPPADWQTPRAWNE